MSKHTPGPWAVNPQTRGDADISVYAILGSGNPHWIARAYGGGPLAPPSPVTAANARLIASAPDLLAALEYIVSWSPDAEKWNAETARNKAAAAIAKAKGK